MGAGCCTALRATTLNAWCAERSVISSLTCSRQLSPEAAEAALAGTMVLLPGPLPGPLLLLLPLASLSTPCGR